MNIHVCGRNFKIDPKKHGKLSMAAWNVRTLLDSAGRPKRRTAIIARELDRYGIDVAALSETRFEATTQFEEVGAGYTFYCIGHPKGETRHGGVGFAIRSSLVSALQSSPLGISPRLMALPLTLENGDLATLISCYAPTLNAPQEEKEQFYEVLSAAAAVPYKQNLLCLETSTLALGTNTSCGQRSSADTV